MITVLAATLAVCFLIGALGWYLQTPGYTTLRLVLFTVIGGAAVLGLYGVVVERATIAGAGIALLFALGFWQAVLWIVVYPVGIVLILATAIGESETAGGEATE